MDLSKLAPSAIESDAEFIVLARQAFDVMMRREFHPVKISDGVFSVISNGGALPSVWIGITGTNWSNIAGCRLEWPDPFTALVEAEKWYREKVEK